MKSGRKPKIWTTREIEELRDMVSRGEKMNKIATRFAIGHSTVHQVIDKYAAAEVAPTPLSASVAAPLICPTKRQAGDKPACKTCRHCTPAINGAGGLCDELAYKSKEWGSNHGKKYAPYGLLNLAGSCCRYMERS